MMQLRNIERVSDTTANCEVLIDGEWMPFTARSDDGSGMVPEVWAAIVEQGMPELNADELELRRLSAALSAANAECARRIIDIADTVTQNNLTANYAVGNLSSDQSAIYMSGLAWIAEMQSTWRQLVEDGLDIYDDANWPTEPAGVRELAAEF